MNPAVVYCGFAFCALTAFCLCAAVARCIWYEGRNHDAIDAIAEHLGIEIEHEQPTPWWQRARAWIGERMQPVMAEAATQTATSNRVADEPDTDEFPVVQPDTEPMPLVEMTEQVAAKRAERWDDDAAQINTGRVDDVELAHILALMDARIWDWRHNKEMAA